ncbi:endoplasmic reticulum retention protein [Microsporum audouinii]
MNIFRLLELFGHIIQITVVIFDSLRHSIPRYFTLLLYRSRTSVWKTHTINIILTRCVLDSLDLFWNFTGSLYNTIFKILFISSSAYTIYLMLNDYKPTNDPNIDTFKVVYLLGASAVLGILLPYKYTASEILWAFSIWLESVAILPQLFMLQRTGEAETITTHYLFALGIYRALYIPNWIYRYFSDGYFDPIAVVAGIIQTVLYADFFWIYFHKVLKGQKFSLPV